MAVLRWVERFKKILNSEEKEKTVAATNKTYGNGRKHILVVDDDVNVCR